MKRLPEHEEANIQYAAQGWLKDALEEGAAIDRLEEERENGDWDDDTYNNLEGDIDELRATYTGWIEQREQAYSAATYNLRKWAEYFQKGSTQAVSGVATTEEERLRLLLLVIERGHVAEGGSLPLPDTCI